ncbi:hypothetical protein DAPPUDRAFT_106828 [Daphnia pulex]|uniref:Uncharacterized protein n=1 Tax=Daphnia pulex TaxID=6669 RepID=E9GV29_DAPPU|nr:hypothetical protein DAPPUDRAFT_106828 [Daphnia pulex]|eukprot:EFX76687.1 hypothetical protein DAPPUDRAFT_106828 [Daphnia pulex]
MNTGKIFSYFGIALDRDYLTSSAPVSIWNKEKGTRQRNNWKRPSGHSELLASSWEDADLVCHMRAAAILLDGDRFDECSEHFQEHIDHLQKVCKLLRHVAPTEALQVQAKYAKITVCIYGPQMLTATHTLSLYPNSKIVKENFQVFNADVTTLAKEVSELLQGRATENHVYISLPRPAKHGTTSKPLKMGKLDSEATALRGAVGEALGGRVNPGVAGVGNVGAGVTGGTAVPMSPTSSGLDENNDIVNELASCLPWPLVCINSSAVPAGTLKKVLLDYVDQIPTYVQQLQFTVKNPTVGKAATFTKVIQETKNCMNCVSKVVSTCFECANKYNLYMSDTLLLEAMASGTGSEEHQTSSSSMMFKPVSNIQSILGKVLYT